tara:strand:- start:364 stop:1680 length:1317 start_codon:yes stop_codon:yes gene_type:complete
MSCYTDSNLKQKSFAIYGLGTTGKSVINFFKKKKLKNYFIWDDNIKMRNIWNLNSNKRSFFFKKINTVDYIIMSPGININKLKNKNIIIKNKNKIITDLDIFYMFKPDSKSIVVTGTNGKSTTCEILKHVLKNNKINVKLGGNIGQPILNLNIKKDTLTIIEASSFQLAYSKFIKPNYALIINISNDHLDWHGSMINYMNAKLKIFSLQTQNDYALISNKILVRRYKKNKYLGKLKLINKKEFKKIKNRINNEYLSSEANEENMSFVYKLSKILKIKEKPFIKSLKSFKGLEHRYENFYSKNHKKFINDSKATTFEASRIALKNNKNIFWIVGGLKKINDKFDLNNLKKNINKAYIIGKDIKYFKNFFQKKKIPFKTCFTLKKAVFSIFKDLKSSKNEKATILLSPACASYDQFKNFEHRGIEFKKIINKNKKKLFKK